MLVFTHIKTLTNLHTFVHARIHMIVCLWAWPQVSVLVVEKTFLTYILTSGCVNT